MIKQTKTLLALVMSGLMASSVMAAIAPSLRWNSPGGLGSFAEPKSKHAFSFEPGGLSAAFNGQALSTALNLGSAQSSAGFDSWYFRASDLSHGLRHFSLTGQSLGGDLKDRDKGSAPPAPIPEPSSYALLLAGMGVVTLVVRRRGLQG
ncbi:hypothetical protein HNP55_001816 [Paucibacter oligotrophus]|uniref:Ice-binding protein C-terminal domain-containing protein n=1 Tax=Roseateles oligotrophus TaxID=1769250 RepID=A0A840LD93_9BURK|nr:PEP-CTERM sorting domain-containing protein [Roseateles oligotrophus]MBB4843297.1 hypothetical protein [Roseateles oligotrophus]